MDEQILFEPSHFDDTAAVRASCGLESAVAIVPWSSRCSATASFSWTLWSRLVGKKLTMNTELSLSTTAALSRRPDRSPRTSLWRIRTGQLYQAHQRRIERSSQYRCQLRLGALAYDASVLFSRRR